MCLAKLISDSEIRRFYSYKYVDDYSEGILNKRTVELGNWHGATIFIMGVLAIALLLFFVTLVVGSFFVQISVIYDVATNPASSKYVNLFVVTFAITSIITSWLIFILQLPMPEVDLSNYSKLACCSLTIEHRKYEASFLL